MINTKKDILFFLLLYGIVGAFTFSITYYVALSAFFVAKFFDNNKLTSKNLLKLFIIVGGGVVAILILNSHLLRTTGNDFLIRVDSIYHNFLNGNTTVESVVGDMSFSTRITLLAVGLAGLCTKPFLGYGLDMVYMHIVS